MHSEHRRRARRWASTQSSALAMRNGSMPISDSRVMALGASLVCSVESTRWPVSADSMAILPVSWSRISPTRMTSGEHRRNERRAAAKLPPKERREQCGPQDVELSPLGLE